MADDTGSTDALIAAQDEGFAAFWHDAVRDMLKHGAPSLYYSAAARALAEAAYLQGINDGASLVELVVASRTATGTRT